MKFLRLFAPVFALFLSVTASAATLKIAIFDNDFSGYENARGRTLPANTQFVASKSRVDLPPSARANPPHGLVMAEILTGELRGLNYDLYLFESRGFSNFRDAITAAIDNQIDIIVHPIVFDYGGNFDGGGFVNAQVNRAIEAGITWYNAAGNYGRTSFTAKPSEIATEFKSKQYVKLPGRNSTLGVVCEPPPGIDKCSARITMTWTAYSNDPTAGTNKDLNFQLSDGKAPAKVELFSYRKQVVGPANERRDESQYPREVIEGDLPRGRYSIIVVNASQNFTSQDELRIATDSPYIQFDHYDANENLYNPADNPNVITVGANDSDRSSRSLKLNKPEITLPSRTTLSNGDEIAGSSVAVVKAAAQEARRRIGSIGSEPPSRDWRRERRSEPTRPKKNDDSNCYQKLYFPPQAFYIDRYLKMGGVIVQTEYGPRIGMPFDPIDLLGGVRRVRPDDMILTTPMGLYHWPRWRMPQVPSTWAELFYLPPDKSICP